MGFVHGVDEEDKIMTVPEEDCKWVLYSYCTYEVSPPGSEPCPYEFADECQVHNEHIPHKQ